MPTFLDNVVIENTTYSPVISPTSYASCNDLTVESGATLVIESNSENTGSLINNGIIYKQGIIEVQHYISDSQWHLFSAPNSVTTAGSFVDQFLQIWDEPTALWSDVTDPGYLLMPGKGYGLWINGSKSAVYTYTGTPNYGKISVDVSFTNNGSGNIGANLLGNPYPSAIDWDFLDDAWGAVYYYNGTAYESWNNGSGTGSQYVPAMQGFFIVAPAPGTFDFRNSYRVHDDHPYYKSIKRNSVVLETTSNNYSDKLTINLNLSSTNGFDLKYDAYKFQSGTEGLSELYSFVDDKILSIDVRPEVEELQLGFNNSENGIYTIGISEVADITEAILEDTKTETFHNLIDGSYEFVWNVTDDEKRFKLHLNAVGVEENINHKTNILIYAANQHIYIKGAEKGKVQVSDILGREVLEEAIPGSGTTSIQVKLKSGVYVVTVLNGNEVRTEKVFIR